VRLLLASTALVAAQSQERCDLVVTPPRCLDIATLGASLVVPANVTRISSEGLVLCGSPTPTLFAPDLVYLVPQTTAARAWAFLGSGGQDSIFVSFTGSCQAWARNYGGGTVVWPKSAWRQRHAVQPVVRDEADSLVAIPAWMDRSQVGFNCTPATDPYSIWAQQARAAVVAQAGLDPSSRAGVVIFHDSIVARVPLRPLAGTSLTRLLDSTGRTATGGFRLAAALDTAARWLRENDRGRTQGMVLVADSDPVDNLVRWTSGAQRIPPLHVVFVGEASVSAKTLQALVGVSGGSFVRVGPESVDSIGWALSRPAAAGSAPARPSLRIVNLDNQQTARTRSSRSRADGTWDIALDSIVGLKLGTNRIRLVTSWETASQPRMDSVSIDLSVSGPTATGIGARLAGGPFSASCGAVSSMEILDARLRSAPWIPIADDSIRVMLKTVDPGPDAVALRTSSDEERVDLAPFGVGGHLGRMPMSVGTRSGAMDGQVQVQASGDVARASWCRERDPRDCAQASVPILPPEPPVPEIVANRCDLATSSDQATRKCLEPADLAGKTFSVGSNVTRIGQDGLLLCAPATERTFSTDIVYVIDQSGSMNASSFWVDPDRGDTVFVGGIWSEGAAKVSFGDRHYTSFMDRDPVTNQWTVYHEIGDRPYGLFRMDDPTITRSSWKLYDSVMGDPYAIRGQAVQSAIRFQASADPQSFAGVIGFESDITMAAPLRALKGAGFANLIDSTGLTTVGGTKWEEPLRLAGSWLLPRVSPDRRQAVVLVSDGGPTDYNYMAAVNQAGFPPIYGIFLGTSGSDVGALKAVTEATGGKIFIVPPGSPDSLQGVINHIVESTVLRIRPTTTLLRNLTTGRTASLVGARGDSAANWLLALDSVLPLNSGANLLELRTRWTNPDGTVFRVDSVRFTIAVGGDSLEPGVARVAATPFDARCTPASRLRFLDSLTRPISSASGSDRSLILRLTSPDPAVIPARLPVTSSRDAEAWDVRLSDSLYGGGWGRRFPLQFGNASAIAGSGVVEPRVGLDTLRSVWCDPRDPRDCAVATLPIRTLPAGKLLFDPDSLVGPRGRLSLRASLPGQTGDSVHVALRNRGLLVGQIVLHRTDSMSFVGDVNVAQGLRSPSGDAMWIPASSAGEVLQAGVHWDAGGEELFASARVLRPAAHLVLGKAADSFATTIHLAGGQPDRSGSKPVRLWSSRGDMQVVLTPGDSLTTGVLPLLTGLETQSAWVHGEFVDPLYGDTLRDSVLWSVPRRWISIVEDSVAGPAGTFHLEVFDATSRADVIDVSLQRNTDVVPFRLARAPSGRFEGLVRFGPGNASGPVDVLLSAPIQRAESIVATLPATLDLPLVSDRLWVVRPAIRLDLRSETDQKVEIRLGGASEGRVRVRSPNLDTTVELVAKGGGEWIGSIDLQGRIEESRDSFSVLVSNQDAWFAESTQAAIRLPSPWFPSSLEVTRGVLDPRSGMRVRIEVRDRYGDPNLVDTVQVFAGASIHRLVETGPGSGIFVLDLGAADLDPGWNLHRPREPWIVALHYGDAMHPGDSASASAVLRFDVPGPAFRVVHSLVPVASGVSTPAAFELTRSTPTSNTDEGVQGVALDLWETCMVSVFVYDHLGVHVASWSGRIEAGDPAAASPYLLQWNGVDGAGHPVDAGIYHVRIVLQDETGRMLANTVLTIGREGESGSSP